MSPSHANKKGVRYRYYVSHALLQNRKDDTGSICRVSAPDVERLILAALRDKLSLGVEMSDRDLIQQHVHRVVIQPGKISVALRSPRDEADQSDVAGPLDEASELILPFVQPHLLKKGIAHAPGDSGTINVETRDTLLQSIARSRRWMDSIIAGKIKSFDEIAISERLAERHVRRLAPLAFLSPRIIQAIADSVAPAGLTVSWLTKSLPHAWSAQEQMFGLD